MKKLFALITAFLFIPTLAPAATTPIPPLQQIMAPVVADVKVPPLYVYEGGAGASSQGNVDRAEALLGKPVYGIVDFAPFTTQASTLSYLPTILSSWKSYHPAAKIAISISVLFNDGSETFAKVTAGDLDPWLKAIADRFVAAGYPDANIRLDEEENGSWYIWSCYKDPTGCKSAFQHAYAVIHAEAPGIKVWFNPALGDSASQQSVDFPGVGNLYGVSVDYYDSTYINGGVTVEPNMYAAEYSASWGGATIDTWYTGLPWAIWEYGVGSRSDGHGACTLTGPTDCDDGYFVQQTFLAINADLMKGRNFEGFGDWDYDGDYAAEWTDGSRPHVAYNQIMEFGSPNQKAIFSAHAAPFVDEVAPTVTTDNCHAHAHQNGPSHWIISAFQVQAATAPAACTVTWTGKTVNFNVYDPMVGTGVTQAGSPGVNSVTVQVTYGHPKDIAVAL